MATRRQVQSALVTALAVLITLALGWHRPIWALTPAHAQRHLTVATYNLYLGADFAPLFSAPDQQELVRRAGQVYAQVVKTDFPSRAEAVAAQLAEDPPDLVGLQEVALWETGPLGGTLTPSYDFLAILLDALADRGLAYRPVATNVNFTGALPIGPTTMASFTDRDVIIVRADRRGARLRVDGAQARNFAARLVIPTPIPGVSFTVLRGWSTVDAKLRGTTVRVANTHLEAFDERIRNLQAAELLGALSSSPHPVVVLGDLNSRPDDTAGAYGMLADAGYADAWAVAHGPAGGFTSGQAANLDNFPSLLDHRIDDVLYEPLGVEAITAEVLGDEPDDRTASGLWPSDHAGVSATLRLGHR